MKNEKQTVGLIGLGNAGMALAQSLVGTFEVVGYDRDQARREVAEVTGVYFASSAKQVSERCQIIILSLPTPAASVAVPASVGKLDAPAPVPGDPCCGNPGGGTGF